MKKYIVSLLVVFMSLPAMAADEPITISGTVRDATETLIGASISYTSANGTPAGTITDMDGKFTLQNVPSNATVTVSFVGCKEQKFTASSMPSTINLNCKIPLKEVVVDACAPDKANGIAEREFIEDKCYPTKCIEPRWKLSGSGKSAKCVEQKCKADNGTSEWTKSSDTYECVVKSCDCGYTLNNGKCEKWDTTTCTNMPENASEIERTCKNDTEVCKVKKCECGYTEQDNNCVKMAADTCTKKPAHATKIGHACNDGIETCIVTECEDGWKPDPETNATACIKKLKECTPEQKEQLTKEHATKTGIKTGTETCIALACECGYDLVGEKCVAWAENTPCATDKLPKDAKSGIRACNERGKEYCQITACLNETEYTHDTEKNRCEYLKGEDCTHSDQNAEHAEYKNVNGKLECTLKKCKKGFYVVDNKCEKSDGDCTPEQLAKIEHATRGERKKDKCTPTECEAGFEVSGNKCVEIGGKCKTKPEHSKKSHRDFVSDTEVCIVEECDDGYRISADGQRCEPGLDEESARKKASELRANADEMKAVEQSTENKLLGAAGMAATGIGGMQLASAISEKNADENAERDMAAYLATFRCDYGHGMNIKGGETGIELPGANTLIPLYQEYVNLANDLKVRKAALGMKPGIESEKILDAATTGLYDNQSIGKVDGAFTSLARALADPNGADAAEWAAQKDATAKKLKTGAIVAGIGIVGSAVGNAIINRNVKEKSDKIIKKYEPLKKVFEEPITPLAPEEKNCSQYSATGTYPDCTCNDNTKYFTPEQGCISCEGGKTWNKEKQECVCPSDKPLDVNGTCTAQQTTNQCKLSGLLKNPDTANCKCTDNAEEKSGVCTCKNGYFEENKTCAECKATENKIIKDGKCVCKDGYRASDNGTCTLETTSEPIAKIEFNSDTLFKSGSAELANKGEQMLSEFSRKLSEAQKSAGTSIDLTTATDYCLAIIGHTDRTKFKGDRYANDATNPNNKNMILSKKRAEAVKTKLSTVANPNNFWIVGMGENKCTTDKYPQRNHPKCRRVDIEFWPGSCEENQQNNTSGMLNKAVEGLASGIGEKLLSSAK